MPQTARTAGRKKKPMRFIIRHGLIRDNASGLDVGAYGRTWVGIDADDAAAALVAVHYFHENRYERGEAPNGARRLRCGEALLVGLGDSELAGRLEDRNAEIDALREEVRDIESALSATQAAPEDDRDPAPEPRIDPFSVPFSECGRVPR